MKLNIVATLYNSAESIEEFCRQSVIAAEKFAGSDFRILLIDDGSTDDSVNMARELQSKYGNLDVFELSKNFGHHRAIMAGLELCDADYVFLIDSDLEESPDWITNFSTTMNLNMADVVFGVQATRKGDFLEQISGTIFWKLMKLFISKDLPSNITTARLMKRKYVESLRLYQEQELFLAGVWHHAGFKQVSTLVNKKSTSQSSYSLLKKIGLGVNSVTSFSTLPLWLIFIFGLAVTLISTILILSNFMFWLTNKNPVSGWTSIFLSVWFLGGSITMSVGIVGIYLSKVFKEVKNRPRFLIKNSFLNERIE